jgi:hypothetical protein
VSHGPVSHDLLPHDLLPHDKMQSFATLAAIYPLVKSFKVGYIA